MHPFDIFVFTVLGIFALIGIKKGLVEELLKIVGLVVAIIVASHFVNIGADFLADFFNTQPGKMTVVSFIVIALGTMILFRILIAMIKGILRFAMLGWLDRTGGAAFGTVKGAILLSALVWLFILLPTGNIVSDLEQESKSFPAVRSVVPSLYQLFKVVLPAGGTFMDQVREYIPVDKASEELTKLSKRALEQRIEEEIGRDLDSELFEYLSRDDLITLLKNPELLNQLREQLQENNSDTQITLEKKSSQLEAYIPDLY